MKLEGLFSLLEKVAIIADSLQQKALTSSCSVPNAKNPSQTGKNNLLFFTRNLFVPSNAMTLDLLSLFESNEYVLSKISM